MSAIDADGRDLQAIVPTDRAGVELFDDWDGFGQRMTASGGTRFTDVEVLPVEVTTVSDGTHLGHSTSFLQLYLAASRRASPRPCSTTRSPTSGTAPDPRRTRWPIPRPRTRSSCRRSARSRPNASAAEAVVLAAADSLDALVDSGRQDDPDALADAAVAVAKAQLVAERLTLTSAQRLFDTGGASATARTLNLDRHWRNVRTLASHSPLDYKAYAAGNYAVNGVAPPANGYF